MHIAILFRRLDTRGGGQRQAIEFALEAIRAGHRVTFYTFSYSKEKCFPKLIGDIPVIALPQERHRKTGGLLGFINESRMARDLARLIDMDTDLLNPHDAPMHHAAYYFKKYKKNIPSVWQMNEMAAMRWPPEMLSIVEDPVFHDIPRRPLWLKKAKMYVRTWYDNFFVRSQDTITVFDAFHKNLFKRFTGRNAIIVPSGTDVGRITYVPREYPPRKEEKLLLLSSGIFSSYRRFEDIFRALPVLIARGYDPHLTILGDYATDKKYYASLQELATRLNIQDRVVFYGKYTDEKLGNFLRENHVFVYPHLQSQGLAANEAIASGLPTIITPFPGTYETFKNGRDALFAKPCDPDSLARALIELLENPALYQTLSREGARTIRERYTWERYTREMLNVFNGVLTTRSSRRL